MTEESVTLPWRVTGLPGANTSSGRTYNGGEWYGGGPVPEKSVAVRVWTPMGKPASVELDLGEPNHGCTVSLKPALAREAAAALLAAADKADAEMQKWRDVLAKQAEEIRAEARKLALGQAGLLDERA